MEIKKLFELLSEKEKEEIFNCALEWKFPKSKEPINEIKEWTDIKKWIDGKPQITKRLKEALLIHYEYSKYKFIEQVEKEYFLRNRNVGIKTWKEFVSFRGF